jgi:YVTN family beta-propeller protein
LENAVTAPTFAAKSTATHLQASPVGRELNQLISGLLGGAANWASGLPGGQFQDLLSGALLLARRQWAGASGAGMAASTATSQLSAVDPAALTLDIASMVRNLTVKAGANGVFTVSWDAPELPSLPSSVLTGWGVDPAIRVASYNVTMSQDQINPYANNLQFGSPPNGSSQPVQGDSSGDSTAWVAGMSGTGTVPTYPAGVRGPFNSGPIGSTGLIPGQSTVSTTGTSYTFDISVGVSAGDCTEGDGCKDSGSAKTVSTPNPYARVFFTVVPVYTHSLPVAEVKFTGKIDGNTLTVSDWNNGSSLAAGDVISVGGVSTTVIQQLTIKKRDTWLGGAKNVPGAEGTYSVSQPQTVGKESMSVTASYHGTTNAAYWAGVEPISPFESLFMDPTAMLSASDGSVWVAYQRSPLAKTIHRVLSWMNPYNQGLAATFNGYIGNEDGTGPGNVLTVEGCQPDARKDCKFIDGTQIKNLSRQAITLAPGGTWGKPPVTVWNPITGKIEYNSIRVGKSINSWSQNRPLTRQFRLTQPGQDKTDSSVGDVDVATAGCSASGCYPVQLVATPTKLNGGWGGFTKVAVNFVAILTGNFHEVKQLEQEIAELPPESKLLFLQALAEPLPEDQVRQYRFVDGSWQMVASFVTTINPNGKAGNDLSDPNGRKIAIPHALVESADGQIFVASRGLAGGIDRNNRSGWARFAPNASKQVGYVQRIGGGQINFTGSIGDGSAGQYPGPILTVTEMGAGSNPIVVGQTVSVPGLAAGTAILKQLTGSDGKAVTAKTRGGPGTYLIAGAPTLIGSTQMSQVSAQTIDLKGSPTWGSFAAAPDGTVWVGINDLGNQAGSRQTKRTFRNGSIEQIAPTTGGSWATQPIKYNFMHPPAGFAITPNSYEPMRFTGSIDGNTLTVSQMDSLVVDGANQVAAGSAPRLRVGQFIAGDGVGPGTTITEFISGDYGGAGTYKLSGPAQKVGVGSTTPSGAAGIAMAADTYALWVNDSTANGRDADPASIIGPVIRLFAAGSGGTPESWSDFKSLGWGKYVNTGGTLRLNNSEDFKLKSTIIRIDSACPDTGCGNRQDVGRGAMGMIAVPGRDAVLAAVGATSFLSEVGYAGFYLGCRVAADGGGGNGCKIAGAGGQVIGGFESKLWKRGDGKIVEVAYDPSAYEADNGRDRTNGLKFLKIVDTLTIPGGGIYAGNHGWLGPNESFMQDAGRPQSLAMGPDGSIYMGGRGSGGAERAAFLGDFKLVNIIGDRANAKLFSWFSIMLMNFVDHLNIMVCEDIKGGQGCANNSGFAPKRAAYDWKTKGSPAFVSQVWTPTNGLLSAPGTPIELGAIPRIQTFGQVYPFASPITVNPKTEEPTGAPPGIFAQNSQFGGALFLPSTPAPPADRGLAATPLIGGVDGDSTTLSWKAPPTPKGSPVVSYTATAYSGDASTSVTTAGTSAMLTGLVANAGTTYYTVNSTNFFGTSSTANGQVFGPYGAVNGQVASGQLWLGADGKTPLETRGLGVGMVTDGTPFTNGGLDGHGNAYSWTAIPKKDSITLGWNGVNFGLGSVASLATGGAGGQQPNQPNIARGQGQTLGLSTAQIAAQLKTEEKGLNQAVNVLNLAGAAVNGDQADQKITLNYTDGTSEVWTQTFSDWTEPGYHPNEAIVSGQAYRNTTTGGRDATKNYVYGYSHSVAQGKTLESVTLPDNPDVVLVGLAMSTAIVVSLGQNVSNSPLNNFGITTPPWQVANHQGFDGRGNYYDAYSLSDRKAPIGIAIPRGNPPPSEILMSWAGATFQVGQIPTSNSEVGGKKGPQNVAQFDGQTIYMPAGTYTHLQMIGASANGEQTAGGEPAVADQKITVNFTDGTTDTWTQTFSDWASTPTNGSVAGQAVVNGGTQVNQLGNSVNRTANVYGYSYAIPDGKTVQSLVLPSDLDGGQDSKKANVGILGIALVGTPSVAPWAGVGIVTDGTKTSPTGGFDGRGYSYSWNLLTGSSAVGTRDTAQATPISSSFEGTINSGVAPAAFSGSITNGTKAAFIAGINSGSPGSPGTTMTVYQVADGSTPLAAGQFLSGDIVAAGTAITQQLSYFDNSRASTVGKPVTAGTPARYLGGAGVYSVSIPQEVVTGAVLEATQPGTILTVDGPITGGGQFEGALGGASVQPAERLPRLKQLLRRIFGVEPAVQAGATAPTCTANCPVVLGDSVAAGTTVTQNLTTAVTFTGRIDDGTAGNPGTTLTATRISGTPLAVGQVISGPGVAAGTVITAQLSAPGTKTGSAGTYTVSGPDQSVSSVALTATQYRYGLSGPAQWSGPRTPLSAARPGNTLTVTSVTDGTITVGQTIGGVTGYSQNNANFTGGINNGQVAIFEGSIDNGTAGNAGNTLTVTKVVGPTKVAVGQYLTGTDVNNVSVASGTLITGFLSGVDGGLGTYSISGTSQSVGLGTPMTASQPGTLLTVTRVNPPIGVALGVNQAVTGPGVAAGTTISGSVTGSGAVGTYTISGPPQWVAPSTVMATTQPGVPVVANKTVITGFVSGTEGGPGVYTVSGDPQAVLPVPMAGNTKVPLSTLATTTPWDTVGFDIGAPNRPNVLRGDGQTVYGSYIKTTDNKQLFALAEQYVNACRDGGCVINLAAAGANGKQPGNTLTLIYSDGRSEAIDQSFSDWAIPMTFTIKSTGGAIGPANFDYLTASDPTVGMMSYPGEWVVSSQAYRDTASGGTDTTKTYVYGHSYWVPKGSTPVAITLPDDQNVGVLSIAVTKPTMVDLNTACDSGESCYNSFAITTAPWQVGNSQGFDGSGNYYDSSNLNLEWLKKNKAIPEGCSSSSTDCTIHMTWAGSAFQVGPIPTNRDQVGGTDGPPNVVRGSGQLSPGYGDGQTIYVQGQKERAAQNFKVVGTIALPGGPGLVYAPQIGGQTLTLSPDGSRLYVLTSGGASVSVIDTATNAVTDTFSVGQVYESQSVAVSGDGSKLYVASPLDNAVTVLNASTGAPDDTIVAFDGPWNVTADADRVYVTNATSGGVSAIDTATNSVEATTGGGQMFNSVLDPIGWLYTADVFTNQVYVVDTGSNTVRPDTLYAYEPSGLALSPDGSRLYVSSPSGKVSAYTDPWEKHPDFNDPRLSTIDGFNTPTALAVSPDGTKLYVAESGANSVSVFDVKPITVQGSPTTVLTKAATLQVGEQPIGLAVSPDGKRVYVANNNGTVSIIATDQNPYNNLLMLGAGNGTQKDQLLKLTFTDGTQDWWYQTFSTWSAAPTDLVTADGEVLVNAGTQINQAGNQTGQNANVYGYYHQLPAGKTLYSLTLPNNPNVEILAMSLL